MGRTEGTTEFVTSASEGTRDRIGIGIVGCGDIFPAHERAWTNVPDCEVRGVSDIEGDLARQRIQSIPGASAFTSLDELLDRCDVVAICTPPDSHRSIALQAMEAGCSIVIEKPIVSCVADWEAIRTRAKQTGTKLGAVYQLKFAPQLQRAQRWLQQGRIGELDHVSFDFFVDPQTDPMLTENGHWSHRLAGGRWFEVLPHPLYLIHMFTGCLQPTADVAVWHSAMAPVGALADGVATTLEGQHCLASLQLSAKSQLDRRAMVLSGSKGQIEIGVLSGEANCTTLGRTRLRRGIGIPYLEAGIKLAQWVPDRLRYATARRGPSNHRRLAEAFVRHVRDEGPPPTSIEEMDSVFRCCAAIGEAIDAKLKAQGVIVPQPIETSNAA